MNQQIISFLNKYTIIRIDSQTSIITQLQQLPTSTSSSFEDVPTGVNRKTSKTHHAANISTRTPAGFLIKDLIIPECGNSCNDDENKKQNEKVVQNILATLAHHQQLNSKYILTLIHYKMFVTNLPNPNSGIESNIQTQRYNTTANTHPTNKPASSTHTFDEPNSRKQQSETHSHHTSRNPVDNYNFGDNSSNSNSICQDDNFEEDSVVMHNKSQSQSMFSQFLNNTNLNANIIVNVNVQTNDNVAGKRSHYNILSSNVNGYSQGPHNAIRAIYQYGSLTLKQQISNRIASSTQFEEQQLWSILATIVQALSYLQQEQIAYGVLGTDKIFINNSLVKILDPSATASDPLLVSQGRLYSPEILNDQENIDIFKSDVYVIGLILLECGLLVDLSKEVEPNLDKYKDVFREEYSSELLDVIEKCLQPDPNTRPTFQQLKQQIGKQLSWTDFSNNYEHSGGKVLQPTESDQEDLRNPEATEIQGEYEGSNFDVLYENLSREEASKYRLRNVCLTQHQRAKIKYLTSNSCSPSNSNSFDDGEPPQSHHSRSHNQNSRYNSSLSPIQLKSGQPGDLEIPAFYYQRPSRTSSNNAVPNLNIHISESVLTNGSLPPSASNRCTESKMVNKSLHEEKERPTLKTNQKWQNSQAANSAQEKMKKTKLIKEKVVRSGNQALEPIIKQKQPVANAQHPGERNRGYKQGNQKSKDRKFGESIEQELYEESENSYLYCNTRAAETAEQAPQGTKGGSKQNTRIGNKISNGRNSHTSERNSLSRDYSQSAQNILRTSGAIKPAPVGRNSTNFDHPDLQQRVASAWLLNQANVSSEQNLPTNHNLLKTIKDDLIRTETGKNQKIATSYHNKDNRYFK